MIALGGNQPSRFGPPERTLSEALRALDRGPFSDLNSSRFFRTPCFPAGAGPDYVNAAARLTFEGSAQDVLARLHDIEHDFGRERQKRWGQRTLDLDLIAVGAQIWPDRDGFRAWKNLPLSEQMQRTPSELILPHPRLQDRAFVLVPLSDVAPDWTHPILGLNVAQMMDALDPALIAEVVPISAS